MRREQMAEERAQYLRTIFDAIPLPTFIVDADVRIHDFNTAAESFLGPQPPNALYRRGGEALHCLNAELAGCGKGEGCQDCVVRNSVNRAMSGKNTLRELHQAELRGPQGAIEVQLLVTTALLPYTEQPRALLLLEDVSEVRTLRGLIPVCPQCKQVRDDKGYWKQIEQYISGLGEAEVVARICPACAERLPSS